VSTPRDATDGPTRFEIKLNVEAPQIAKAMQIFGIEEHDGKDRRIWFGEIIDGRDGITALPLSARGVILRVRTKANGSLPLHSKGATLSCFQNAKPMPQAISRL